MAPRNFIGFSSAASPAIIVSAVFAFRDSDYRN